MILFFPLLAYYLIESMFSFYSDAGNAYVSISKIIENLQSSLMTQPEIESHSSIYSIDISTVVQSILDTASSLGNIFGQLTAISSSFTQDLTSPPSTSSEWILNKYEIKQLSDRFENVNYGLKFFIQILL